jgi:pimeloyl-ACP methyl ester carboxylesterase
MRCRRTLESVAGHQLAVEILTPESVRNGPPIVFLHEGLGSIAGWKGLPAALAANLSAEIIVYDRLGHGGSDPLPAPRSDRYLHVEAEFYLPALLDRLGLRRVGLVGHSDGGTIALLFAAAFPERVTALAAIAAHVLVEDITIASIHEAQSAFTHGRLARRLARQHGSKTEALFAGWADTWLAPLFHSWNIEHALPRVIAPALIVQGEADAYGTVVQVKAISAGVAGDVQTVLLPDVGHSPHLEAPELLLEHLTRFFLARM